jgi:hypothetical protein
MRAAYVDTSCLVAIRFAEPGSEPLAARLADLELFSANLLEAEFRAALAREQSDDPHELLDRIQWILPDRPLSPEIRRILAVEWIVPDRPLSPEIRRILAVGYLRGSDLWHLATALYLAEAAPELPFLTLDLRQRELASQLGFETA